MIFRIRLYLIYFFSSKRIEKCAYFFSHFQVVQKYNNIFVNVFIYDGAVEGLMDNLFVEHYAEVKRFNVNPKKRKRRSTFVGWKILIVLNWMHRFLLYSWPLRRLGILLKALSCLDKRRLN